MRYFLLFVLCAVAAIVTGKIALQQNAKPAPVRIVEVPTAPPYGPVAGATSSVTPAPAPTHEPMIDLAPPLRVAYNELLNKKIREWREDRLLELAAGKQPVPNIDSEMFLMNIEIPFDELCRLQDSAREEILKKFAPPTAPPTTKNKQ